MARRKDHSPAELKQRIKDGAIKLIQNKGLSGLTARALAQQIGYTAGTIYNFYRDMDALITDVNQATLQELHAYAQAKLKDAPAGYASIRALANAYIDFATSHESAFRTLFIAGNRSAKKTRLPASYQARLADLFRLIEETLRKNMNIDRIEAARTGRLLWTALHGVTSLMLDGRLNLIGIDDPHEMVDDLLRKYLGLSA